MSDSLVLPTFVLIIVYLMVFVIAIIRVVKIFTLTSDWRHTKLFYISVAIGVFLRALFFVVLIAWGSNVGTNWSFIFLTLPECIFIAIFMELFWLMTSIYFYAHLTNEITETPYSFATDRLLAAKSKLSGLIALAIAVWIGVQLILYMCLLIGRMDTEDLGYEIAFMNIICACFFLSIIIYLSVKFSGSPYRAPEWGARLKRSVCMMLTWSIARIFIGILNFFDPFSSYTDSDFYSDFNSNTDTLAYLMYVGFIIVCEIA